MNEWSFGSGGKLAPWHMALHIFLGVIFLGVVIYFNQSLRVESAGNLNVPITVKETAGVGTVNDPFPITAVVPLSKGGYQNTNQFKLEDSSGKQVPAQFSALNLWPADSSIRHIKIEFQPSVGPWNSGAQPFTTGIATYYLKDCGGGACPSASGPTVSVNDIGTALEVNTGQLKFQVKKSGAGFNVIDRAWFDQNGNGQFESSEEVLSPNSANGGALVDRFNATQQDSAYADTVVTVEESGPMRAVIKAEAPALYYDTTNPNNRHGFAVRIYAYAGKPDVKIDYQLKNDPKNQKGCSGIQGTKVTSCPSYWPLYFENADVNFKFNLGSSPTATFGFIDDTTLSAQVGGSQYPNGLFTAQELHNTEYLYDAKLGQQNPIKTVQLASNTGTPQDLFSGSRGSWLDVSNGSWGVTGTTRYFWQRWPNGLSIDQNNNFSFQLWPWWSAQLNQQNGPKYVNTNPSLYWLHDGQDVYKEMLLRFHSGSVNAASTNSLLKTFNHYPVPVVPTSWYDQTKATLDGGIIGPTDPASQDLRLPDYDYTPGNTGDDNFKSDIVNDQYYQFNWVMFRDTDQDHQVSCNYGGWPHSGNKFIVSGNPEDFWNTEQQGIGEINIRPQWVTGYTDAADYSWLKPQNYHDGKCGRAFREFYGNGISTYDALKIPGTETYIWGTKGIGVTNQDAQFTMRDNQYGWWYEAEKAYYYTANPWLRDWYDFIKEAVWGELDVKDNYPDNNDRARAHKRGLVNAAFRVTSGGQTSKGSLYGDAAQGQHGFQWNLENELLPASGQQSSQDPIYGHFNANKPAREEFAAYHMENAIIPFMEEVEDTNPQAWAEAFNYLSGGMEANYNQLHFCYNCTKNSPPGVNGQDANPTKTGISVAADPISWYAYKTGITKYLTDPDPLKGLDAAIQWQVCQNTGNAGGGLYNTDGAWWTPQKIGSGCVQANPKYLGDYYGRYYLYARNVPKADTTAPKPITDLHAILAGNSTVLTWTTPNDSDLKKFHIVWGTKPITAQWSVSPSTLNWWAANAIGPGKTLAPKAGQVQTYTISASAPYAAIFTFDTSGNISPISNVAYASLTGNDSQFVNQSVPATMAAGQSYLVSVTMKNSGVTNWTSAGGYLLGNPGLTWGNWVNLSSGEVIAPGQAKTFSWTVTAPSVPGTYNFQWQMIQNNVEWFGAASQVVPVVVTTKSASTSGGATGGSSTVEKPGSGSGNIEVKRVGPDLTTQTLPGQTTAYIVDAELSSSSNPAIFKNLSTMSHIVGITDISGYDEAIGTCTYTTQKTCLVNSFPTAPFCDGSICSASVKVSSGATTKVTAQYTVSASVDNPPTVTLTGPTNGSTVPSGNITFTFNATDDKSLIGAALYFDVGSGMQPYNGYQPTLSGTKASGSITLPNIPASLNIKWDVKVCDNKLQCSMSKAPWSVMTQGAAADNPPSVTLVSPANGASVQSGNIVFTFSATDDTQLVGASLFVTAGGKTLPYNASQPKLSGNQGSASITLPNVPPGITFQWNVLVAGSGSKGLQYAYAPLNFTVTTKAVGTVAQGGKTEKPPTPTPPPPKTPQGADLPPVNPPAPPSDLRAAANYADTLRIVLRWQDNSSDETGFNIEKSVDGSIFVPIDTVSAGSIAYNDFKVVRDKNYWYRVTAYNSGGNSLPTNAAAASTISGPTSLTALGISQSQVKLNWVDNSSIETHYIVERSVAQGAIEFRKISADLPPNTNSFSDYGLDAGNLYWYRVQAINASGQSPYSNPAFAQTTPLQAPPPVTNTNVLPITPTQPQNQTKGSSF